MFNYILSKLDGIIMSSNISITKRFEFSGSHRLWREEWSAEENKRIFGNSANLHGHGHNFVLFVTISGEIDDVTGMIINLSELKAIVNDVVIRFDHKFLNMDTPFFKDILPTLENIATVLFKLIDEKINSAGVGKLKKIRLQQGNSLSAEVWR
jgi:6-pyruvoyltetrahydropterin/6-carboxytetrahydropterin synthase